jgi:hypothetical protein
VSAFLAGPWLAPAAALVSLAAVAAGAALGATVDRLTAAARSYLTPDGSHRRCNP